MFYTSDDAGVLRELTRDEWVEQFSSFSADMSLNLNGQIRSRFTQDALDELTKRYGRITVRNEGEINGR